MHRRFGFRTAIGLVIASVLAIPSLAAADGGSITFAIRTNAITPPGGGTEIHARPIFRSHAKATLISGGDSATPLRLPGIWALQSVGYNNASAAGLSADGNTLVLRNFDTPADNQGFPRRTVLDVLSTNPFAVTKRIVLPSGFAVDALSPDGSTLFLVQYPNERDQTRYAVRSYDIAAGRLNPTPIVDPDEHEGEMRGMPVNRIYSPDGRWAYTLYDGGEDGPFIHALDTEQGKAHCIDLPSSLQSGTVTRDVLAMARDGQSFTVVNERTGPQAVVDTRSLEASVPPTPRANPASSAATPAERSSSGWLLLAGGLAILGLVLAFLLRHRHWSAPAG